MERSIVMFGKASWCITLPKSWILKYGLGKGKKLEVTEQGDTLLLRANRHIALLECKLDLQGIDYRLIDKLIGACYKKGYDIITIKCETPAQYDEIIRIIESKKLGLYEKTDNMLYGTIDYPAILSLSVSAVVSESKLDEQIHSLVKELYRINDDFIRFWTEKKWARIHSLALRDMHINDSADICRRIININPKDSTSTSLYVLVTHLEHIGDCFKHIFPIVAAEKRPISSGKRQSFEGINESLLLLFNLIKYFDMKKLQKIMDEMHAIKEVQFENPVIRFEYSSIKKKISECVSSLMVANL